MTNEDLAESIRPLIEYIKTQIPCICDQHAETLAAQLIAGLPHLFAEQPEAFSRALCLTPQMKR
ncbi:hypothetical protein H6H01_35200 [Nostoc calcicola FACHB-3891]|nr:hypothetical protein [Nostoc calcicola FACHB-3891]